MNDKQIDVCRISKYDPEHRDHNGVYHRDEWTSYWDLGSEFKYGGVLTRQRYLEVEEHYIQAIKIFFRHYKCKTMWITQMVRYDEVVGLENREDAYLNKTYHDLYEGFEVPVADCDDILKLLLRKYIWCRLMGGSKNISARTGTEYYLYFFAMGVTDLLPQWLQLGLHIG